MVGVLYTTPSWHARHVSPTRATCCRSNIHTLPSNPRCHRRRRCGALEGAAWTKHAHHSRVTHLVITLTLVLNLYLVLRQVATYMVVMQRCW